MAFSSSTSSNRSFSNPGQVISKRFGSFFQRIVSILVISFVSVSAYAGSITAMSVSETSLEAAAASTYTFTFTPQTTVSQAQGNISDGTYFIIDMDNDFTVSGASLVSITPSTGMAINNRNDSTGTIRMYRSGSSGSIQGGQSYTVVISGIVNPAIPQIPGNHTITTSGGSGTIDSGSVAASEIVAATSNPPAVTTQISDRTELEESQGLVQHVADLNSNFVDLDGDTLTFTASSSDTTVADVVLSGANNRVLSLRANKFGTATITVRATSVDGFIEDQFNVSTIGAMTVNSISSTNDVAGGQTNITVNLTLESQVDRSSGDGAYIVFDLPNSFIVDSSSVIQSITPTPPGSFSSNRSVGASSVFMINDTSFGPGTYTVEFGPVTNPGTAGAPGDILISTVNGSSLTFDKGTIAAPAIGAAGTPTVTSPIADRINLREALGSVIHVADLNSNFNDSDGDTLTFTATSDDTSVVSVTNTGANGGVLSLQANKFGTADVTVRATASDGFVEDTFTVTTIGQLSIDSINPTSNFASQEADYSFTFTLETAVSRASGDGAYIVFDFPDDYGLDSNTLIKSISPDPGGSSDVNRNESTATISYRNTSNDIAAGTYTVVVGPVTNPSSPGSAGSMMISTVDGSSTTFDDGSLATPVIQTNEPTVSSEIPDQLGLKKVNGAVQISADLNNNFEDLDGDTITFTVASSDDTVVEATTSGTDGRILTIDPKKFGSATITVTATTSDGFITDEFDVSVLGTLLVGSLVSTTNNIADRTKHTITLTIETPVLRGVSGAYISFDYPDDFGVDGSTIISPQSGLLSEGSWSSGFDAASSTIFYRNTGLDIPAGTYSFEISQLLNPASVGSFGSLLISSSNDSIVAPSTAIMFDMGSVDTPAIFDNKVSVSAPIADLLGLKQSDGMNQYVDDLNDHFSDSAGGTLSFTAVSSDDSIVSVTTTGTNGEVLTLEALKAGNVTITVSATSPNGAMDDEFEVSAIGALAVSSISSSNDLTFHETDVTVEITLDSEVSIVNESSALIVFDFPDTFGVDSSSTIKSITPTPVAGGTFSVDEANSIVRYVSAGEAIPAGTYTVVIGPVFNPSSAGLPGNLLVSTQSSNLMYDMGMAAMPAIVASNAPALDSGIPDQAQVKESTGPTQVVADLNTHFSDADGDTLTFTAASSDNAVVTVMTSGVNGQELSIEAKKFGVATVTVTATSIDGFTTDEFDVSTIGELTFNSISSTSETADEPADFEVNFTLEETVSSDGGDGAYLFFTFPPNYGLTANSDLINLPPELVGTVTVDQGNSTISIVADAANIPANTYMLTITGVRNPNETGNFGELHLETRNGGGTTFDEGSITMPEITIGPSTFFVIPLPNGKSVVAPQ